MPIRLNLREEELRALHAPGFFMRDDVLGHEAATAVRDEVRRIVSAPDSTLRPAGVSRAGTTVTSIRDDRIAWVDRALAEERRSLGPVLELFDALKLEVNEGAWLGLERYELQLALYPGGGAKYVRHRDAFSARSATGSNRRLTAIFYLNDGWRPQDGGQLRVYPDDSSAPVDIEPRLDRLLVFLSDRLEHEVLPAFTERLALTAWFHGRG